MKPRLTPTLGQSKPAGAGKRRPWAKGPRVLPAVGVGAGEGAGVAAEVAARHELPVLGERGTLLPAHAAVQVSCHDQCMCLWRLH